MLVFSAKGNGDNKPEGSKLNDRREADWKEEEAPSSQALGVVYGYGQSE